MGEDKKSTPPAQNPATAIKTPSLPTKSTRDDASKLRTPVPKGGKK